MKNLSAWPRTSLRRLRIINNSYPSMAFDRENMVPPKESNRDKYPKTLEELTQEVFSLLAVTNSLMKESKSMDKEVYESIAAGGKKIARDTFKLFKDPDAETDIIKSWKEGLDILRKSKEELEQNVSTAESMKVEEMDIEPKEKRQKEFFSRLGILETRVRKVASGNALAIILKDIKLDYVRAITNNNLEEETGAWRGLKGLEDTSDEGFKQLEKLIKELKNELFE